MLAYFFSVGLKRTFTAAVDINAKVALMVVFGTFLYACMDEWHQSFSMTREASWIDVVIDTSGGLLFVACCGIRKHFAVRR